MAEQEPAEQTVDPTNVDFDAIYRGENPFPGTDAHFEVVPWDIGEPQAAVVSLDRAGGFRGQVLDAGCGAGENALFLAERGHSVTAFDGAPTAIEHAQQRARERGVDVEWLVADATKLTGFAQRFDTILDSALYHCLTDEQRFDYSAALHRVSKPGAILHLFCFADGGPERFPGPAPVSKDNLHTCLDQHWEIKTIEQTTYATAFTREILARLMERMGGVDGVGVEVDPESLAVDDHGRIVGSMWQVRAERLGA